MLCSKENKNNIKVVTGETLHRLRHSKSSLKTHTLEINGGEKTGHAKSISER